MNQQARLVLRIWLLSLVLACPAWADPTHSGDLTQAQRNKIRVDVATHQDLNSLPRNPDGYAAMADLYNLLASPNYYVFKTSVDWSDIGEAFDLTELDNLPALKLQQLQTVIALGPLNPTLPNRRSFLNQVFVGQPNTLANMFALWRRLGTRIEGVLIASGQGTIPVPGVLGFEGVITGSDIEQALANGG